MAMTEQITKINGRYRGYTTLTVPIGRTPEEQHKFRPTYRELEAGQVYMLTYETRTIRLEIIHLVHILVEFSISEPDQGDKSLGGAAVPRMWFWHMLDHRGARLVD